MSKIAKIISAIFRIRKNTSSVSPAENTLEYCLNWFKECGRMTEINKTDIPYNFRLLTISGSWLYVIFYDNVLKESELLEQWDRVYDSFENVHIIAADDNIANSICIKFNKWVQGKFVKGDAIMYSMLTANRIQKWGRDIKITNCRGRSRFDGTRTPIFN